LRFRCSEVDEWVHRQDEDSGEQETSKPGARRQKTQPQKRTSASR
jgi:hypothetical protein